MTLFSSTMALTGSFVPPKVENAARFSTLRSLHQRRFRTLQVDALDVRRTYQGLQVLADADLPDALVELGANRTGDRLVGQLLAFDTLVDERQVVAVTAFQRLLAEADRQTEQLALELRHGLALADLAQRATLRLRRARRVSQRQFDEALRRLPQLPEQLQRLLTGQAARLGIIRRAGQHNVPHGEQGRAEKALRIARVIRAARLFLGQRQRYFPLDQHTDGGFFFALAGFSPCHQAQLGDALLQQLAQHQCLSRQIDGLVTALRW